MLARIDEVQQACENQGKALLELLQKQQVANKHHAGKQLRKLDEVDRQLATQVKESRNILGVAKNTLYDLVQIKSLLIRVSENVLNLQITISNSLFLRGPDPPRGVVLEDPLGRQLPIPAEWIDTLEWEVCLHWDSSCYVPHWY